MLASTGRIYSELGVLRILSRCLVKIIYFKDIYIYIIYISIIERNCHDAIDHYESVCFSLFSIPVVVRPDDRYDGRFLDHFARRSAHVHGSIVVVVVVVIIAMRVDFCYLIIVVVG